MKKRILILTGILALGIASHLYIGQNYTGKEGKISSQRIGEKKVKSAVADIKIKNRYKWNLDDIYRDWSLWEKDFSKMEKMMDEINKYKGKISEAPKTFIEFLKLQEEVDILSYKVYLYPNMKKDLDGADQKAGENLQRIITLFSQYTTSTAWVTPEILTIPRETVVSWIKKNRDLKPYEFNLMEIYRLQEHTLDAKSEKLISYYGQYQGAPKSIYSELSTTDIKFGEVEFKDGTKLPMTYGNYSKIMATNMDQGERKKAFDTHYKTFEDYKNTYGAIYRSSLQRDFAVSQTRNYKSTLEAALEQNDIPTSVYENLIEVAKTNSEPLKRYAGLRKKILGLESYHSYDGSIPLVDFQKEYEYDDAKQYVYDSIAPLGKDYSSKMKTAISDGWIDVYESKGKRSGAYSVGVYGVHPYMLMNYNKTLDNVFTLAHELGHTMHTLLSSENQPFATHDYTIFVAEVASTFNERLLLDHMLKNTVDPKEKIALLQQAIRGITGTFYFQSLLADYELQAHRLVEEGKPVTPDVLSKIMADLFREYYGDSTETDKIMEVLWARIPHFFNSPYYVYQYATCFASSSVFYDRITNENYSADERKEALEKYLTLLKSGGNDNPMNQLKKAGVDLSKRETVEAVSKDLDRLLDQLEEEIGKLKNNTNN
ncbi:MULTISPECIES: oligoendopeptidase F [Psychrilyobacter]|uniref:Oligopeptidase F n=1 Tax=Psychrilyobacter piezotolerans TaxID=2293438 RepID=A0ABX9KKA7_9FUSO|nr:MULTISPECIES: oligoendopeptidase F [Psychrilyobacter]MCS5421620.1 oligoendopeptidase F [Psychrilyobacter sp. S5]NDI76685.1 oligoendopeptidase F [Psychrilyobacter piezotolerans]RDE65309.1 oligoendopeptidase F [Psychrilyobacter sp. S5]REI42927.1 oligoendopeptidase F [Psychrilyobacter piezotolerans]